MPAPLITCVAPGLNAPSTVIVPLTLKFTPLVVVPELIFRLLNEVKTVAGKVLFAVNSTVPVLGDQVEAVLSTVIGPLTLSKLLSAMLMALV